MHRLPSTVPPTRTRKRVPSVRCKLEADDAGKNGPAGSEVDGLGLCLFSGEGGGKVEVKSEEAGQGQDVQNAKLRRKRRR